MDERVIVDFKGFIDSHQKEAETLEDNKDVLSKKNSKKAKTRATARGTLLQRKSKVRRHKRDVDNSDSDLDEGTDIMEFKAYKSLGEAKDTAEPGLGNISGLAESVSNSLNVPMEDFELLFPALVPAFSLKDKAWRWILSDALQEMEWNRVAFESLQLESKKKSLIQSLISGHRIKSSSFDDVVPGKGQGLVFLLHGYVSPPRGFKKCASDSFS